MPTSALAAGGIYPGLVLDLSSLDLADIAEALADQTDYEHHWLINPETGELERAIQGRGAFRRFKDELHEEHPGLLPAWHAFRDARATRRAVEWLADNSLIDDQEAERFLAGHPDPELP